ncbi:MAG: hypothetical protein ACREE2_21355 [Stellaceae bacterium]
MRLVCICGLAAEARLARRSGLRAVVGAGDRAQTAALIARASTDADCLVSFGIAGALAPLLRAGDVVMSTEVVAARSSWRAPEPFCRDIADLADELGAQEGPVLGAPKVLATGGAKRQARQLTGGLAVDLESDLVAAGACRAGITFAVIRAIADPASRDLPPAALLPLTANGTADLSAVIASLMRHPRQIRPLFGVARETRAALAALVGPARALRRLTGAT